jgi:hypothetical protein
MFLGGVLLLMSMPGVAPAAAQDLDEFQQTIRLARAQLSAPDPDVEGVISLLEGVRQVTLPDGTVQVVDLWPIIADLRSDPPHLDRARTHLETLSAALDRAAPGVDADAAQATLERVLARDEFAVRDETQDSTFWSNFWDWVARGVERVLQPVAEWLDRLFGPAGGTGGVAAWSRILLGIVGITFIVVVLVAVFRTVRRSMTGEVAQLREDHEQLPSAAEARADAERLLQEGNYRAALRALYLATLLRLEEAGRLRFDRSLTNLEVLQTARLANDALLLERLSPLVERFDRVWYGGQPCSAEDYQAFSRLAERAWDVGVAT